MNPELQNTLGNASNALQGQGGFLGGVGNAIDIGQQVGSVLGSAQQEQQRQRQQQRQERQSEIDDYIDSLDNQLDQIQMPALAPDFDSRSNRKRARRKAAKAQNPVYERKLNQFMEEFDRQREQARTGAQQGRQELRTELEQTREDVATEQQREKEDFQTDIEEQTQEQRTTERVGGREFNRNRRDLQEDVAARNMATSGLGRQEITEAEEDRATQVQRTEQEFENKEAARQRLRDRTLDDLMTRKERAEESTERGIEKVDVNLENELARIRNQQKRREFDVEQSRLDAVREDQERIARQQTLNWINSINDPRQRQAARRAYL